jgi:hypothetical protein
MHNPKGTVHCDKMILKKAIIINCRIFLTQPQIICLNQQKNHCLYLEPVGKNGLQLPFLLHFRPAIKARKSTAWASYLQYKCCKASLHTTYLNIFIRGKFNYKRLIYIPGDFSGTLQLEVTYRYTDS